MKNPAEHWIFLEHFASVFPLIEKWKEPIEEQKPGDCSSGFCSFIRQWRRLALVLSSYLNSFFQTPGPLWALS